MEPVRVLMAEDDDNDAELVRRELGRSNVPAVIEQVGSATSFAAALASFRPDTNMWDHDMPGFGGPRALALAKQLAPDVPFILVTGSLDEETAVNYLKTGAADHILKDRTVRLGPPLLGPLGGQRERAALRRHERLLHQIIDAN